MLDPDVRKELRSLTRESADLVAQHLVMTGRLVDDDPERALAHARAARAMAGRVGVVREAAGVAAYAAGEWAEALSELRTARRITGRPEHLGVMADCERALGRPERALVYADDPEVGSLAQDQRVELVIVLAGARRDLGQADAAVLTLQDPARRTSASRPWAARLWYAYADALLAAGRAEEARTWFERVAEVDAEGETDAGDRLLELDGVVLEDLGDDDGEAVDLPDDQELAAFVAQAFPRPEPGERATAAPSGGELEGAALSGEGPVDDAPVDDAPVDDAPVDHAPVDAPDAGAQAVEGTAVEGTAGTAATAPATLTAPVTRAAPFHAPEPPAPVEQAPAKPALPAGSLMPQFASPPELAPDGAGADQDDDDPV